jgi:hypothetical protein
MCTYFQKKLLSVLSTFPGSHTLHYNLTVRSQDGYVEQRYFAVCYFNDQPILHYDSKKRQGRSSEALGNCPGC